VSSRACKNLVSSAILLLSMLLDAGSSLVYAEIKLDAAFDATLLGLPIGKIIWVVELQDHRFKSVASGAISGFLRIFLDAQGDVVAHGTLSAGRPIASDFALKIAAGKWSDDVRIVFSGEKAREYVTTSPLPSPSPNQIPLTDASRVGVVDPMTALLVYVPGTGPTAVPEACQRTIAVFDGHTRYNLRLAFKRLDKVKTDYGYQGLAIVCSIKFFPLAGYDPEHFLVTYLAAHHDTEIWLAPLAGSRLMVPYRVTIPTPMGLGVLQATKFESLPAKSGAN
jgi:Protein of unknown function (DUF3108)